MLPRLLAASILSLFASSTRAVAADATCYYPDGSVSEGTSPCNRAGSQSSCCGVDDICLTNGLCYQQGSTFGTRISRGACTDDKWDDAACPHYCKHVPDKINSNCVLVMVDNSPTANFCCGAGYAVGTEDCFYSRLGTRGNASFGVGTSQVIFDRATGSTTAPSTKSSTATTAVAAGIAVPLGVSLIAALVAVWLLFSSKRKLQRQLEEKESIGLLHNSAQTPSPGQTYSSMTHANNYGYIPAIIPRPELSDGADRVLESDSRPVVQEVSASPAGHQDTRSYTVDP